MDYIVMAIPVFFLLIGLELLIAKLTKTKLYRFNDAVTNISCGIAQQLTIVFTKTAMIIGYIFLYEHFRIFNISDYWLTYLILFIGVDFFYYWFHRLSHEINFLWGAHIVHHQSEEYNLSVALRQSSLQGFYSIIFYLPLAIIGFNPIAFVAINAFQTLYQFWIHTKTINKLPAPLEFIFNTPSHHRVHHGRNPKYIDKNHGGTLIVFDRMFGTFQREEEKVIYGVTKPLASWNPIWANFDYYYDMWKIINKPMNWKDRLKYLFAYPGWQPENLGGVQPATEIGAEQEITYDTTSSVELNYYILFQYAIVLSITSLFLFNLSYFDSIAQIGITVWIIVSILTIGGNFEHKRWANVLEYLRLASLIIMAWYIFPENLIVLPLTVIAVLLNGWAYRNIIAS